MPPTNNLDPDLSALTFPTTEEEAEDSTLFPPRNLHPSTGPSNFRTRLESISSQTTGGATSIYTDANDQSGARSSQATFRLAQEGESDTEGEGGGRSYSFVDADESIRRDSMSTIARSVAESQDDGVTPRASRFIPEGMEHHQQQQQLSHDEAKVPAEGRVTELAGLAALSTIPIAASIPDHQSSSTKTSSEPLRIQPNLLSHNSGAGSSSTTSNSIVTPTGLGLNKGASSHGESEKGSSEKRKGGKDVGSEIVEMEDPELAGLNEEQKRIVREQIHEIKRTPATFVELFRFTTKFEIFLNALGILGAIVSGAAQPLMTVVFGSLTTAFVAFNTAALSDIASPTYAEDLALAKDHLFGIVNADVLYLVYIGIAMFVATFVYMGTWIYTGEITTRRIRERYLQSVLRQNVAYFDKIGAGEVTTRIQTDMSLIQEGISDKIPITVMFLSTFVTGFVVAFVRNWRLALVVSTIVPAIAIAGSLMNKYMSEYRRLMLEQTAVGGTLVEEVVSSVRNTHAFGTQKKLASMYDVNNVKTLNLGIRSSIVNAVGMLIFFFIIYCAYALAFFYGTTLILEGKANAGQIVNVFFAILIGAFSLAQIAPNLQALSFALGAATSIFATIDRVPIIDSSSTSGIKPAAIEGFIEFNNVDFIYPARPSVQVLHEFTAQFPRGKMTALVGASGSGKSTIVGLIERFYDPVGGSIKVDGVELRELNVKWLRTQIGLVSQEPTLFATTVAGNIEHGLIGTAFENESPELRRQRVIAAAVQANADGFITSLPERYDTMIGERGMLLSGGQKQRIAIARAIVGNPQILLLDEATSALDTASEAIVQDALDRASTGRTTITIAHRLSTIKDADQIIVMSAGRILESALTEGDRSAHVELLSRDGAYSRLVTAQRFRERTTTEGDDSEAASIIEEKTGGLTRAEADELAKNEKPMFENLRRAGTGMSAASEALAAKNRDLENGGKEKKGSFPYLLYRILLLNKADRWTYVAGVIASIVVGVTYPVFAIVFGGVIGAFSQTGSTLRTAGNHYAGICFAIAIVSAIAVGVQSYSFGSSAERLSRILRVGTFAAILRQDIAYFDQDENSTGHLTSSVSDWAQKIQGLFGITAGVIIQSCFTLIAGSIVGLSYAWKVALVGISCFPFTIAAGLVRLQVVVLKDAKNKKAHEASAQMACEAAGAIRTVASLTREDDCCEIYSGYLDGPQKQSNRTAIYANAWYSLSQSLTFWVIGLIFWYGSHQLAAQEINSKQFFVAMIGVIFGSIQAGQVFTYVPDMSKARGAADDVVKLLDSTPEIDAENATGAKFEDCQGSIRFNDVHFRYPTRPHVRVLRGLNLEVKPGQFVAIVGPSGCGKSTLIQLVERFYDPLAGTVTVDGQDVSELNIQSYREHISLVSQEPTLYAGSVRFNITLGATVPADQVSQADVEQACKDANIHDFVLSLPDGYDTEVGGKGAQLSGGQKQRIAIARALIRNPKILLLDEATSALDSESEKVVQAALDQAAKGRTTIAVAHRLSTIQGADVIYILKDGKVAEQGKHFELLAKNGIYAELVSQQNLEKRS